MDYERFSTSILNPMKLSNMFIKQYPLETINYRQDGFWSICWNLWCDKECLCLVEHLRNAVILLRDAKSAMIIDMLWMMQATVDALRGYYCDAENWI